MSGVIFKQKNLENQKRLERVGDHLETRGESSHQLSIYNFVYPEVAHKLVQELQPLQGQLQEVETVRENMMTSLEELIILQQQDKMEAEALR